MSAQDKQTVSTCITLARNICQFTNKPQWLCHPYVHRMFMAYLRKAHQRGLQFPQHELPVVELAYRHSFGN